ncbi:MAG TPA: laccase domain-containing protein, partial [Nitrospiria bacterium]|nr:laccase domain-containing protein [Nitrospiria bacterium]
WTDIIEERDKGKGMLNLEGLNKRQLLDLGMREERTFSVNLCTSCHPVRLPSYRRDGKVIGNIYSGIMIGE